MRLERLAGDEIAYEVVNLPGLGSLLESISATEDLKLCALLYGVVMVDLGSLSLAVATGPLVISSRTI